MFNILSGLRGRANSRSVEPTKRQTVDAVRPLDNDEVKLVSGGRTMPPSGSSEGGGFYPPAGHVDPRAI